MPKARSKCKIKIIKVHDARRAFKEGGPSWARVKFQSGSTFGDCVGLFECQHDMIVIGQEYTGNLFKKKFKGVLRWNFNGRPSDKMNHLVNYQLCRVGVKEKVRALLFFCFKPIPKLIQVVDNKKWEQLTSLQGVARGIVKKIEQGCLAVKENLKKNEHLRTEFPLLCDAISPKQMESLKEYLGAQLVPFLRNDPYRIIFDDEFDGLYQNEHRSLFLKQTTHRTRCKMAAKAAADLNLSGDDNPGRRRYLAIDVVRQHIQKTKDYNMPIQNFKLCVPTSDERWPIIQCGDKITLKKYYAVERSLENSFEQVVENFNRSHLLCTPPTTTNMLDETQCKAVQMACENPLFILTGGAGTGKTSVCKEIVKCFEGKVTCIAPTGKASKRMSEVTGCEAVTTHRLYYSKSIPVHPTLLFDEQSMQEPEILAKLLKKYLNLSTPKYSDDIDTTHRNVDCNEGLKIERLIFVGDTGQMTSVGPGQFLKDICKSDIPSLELTRIYRCGPTSFIASNGFKIRTGDVHLDTSPESFEIIPYTTDQAIVDRVVEIEKKTKKRAIVLCNTNREIAAINTLLRAEFNPLDTKATHEKTSAFNLHYVSKNVYLYPKWRFATGDSVICVKNKYTECVPSTLISANGDVGIIIRINPSFSTPEGERTAITVAFDGSDDNMRYVRYVGYDEFSLFLRPAYALTVNKAQGSEYEYVIVKSSSGWGDKRERFYTAVSRAKVKCIVYEEGSSNTECILSKASHRNTSLCNASWSLPFVAFKSDRNIYTEESSSSDENAILPCCDDCDDWDME